MGHIKTKIAVTEVVNMYNILADQKSAMKSMTTLMLQTNHTHLNIVQHHAGHHHAHPSQQVGEKNLETDGYGRLLLHLGHRHLGPLRLLLGWRLEDRGQEEVILSVYNASRTPWALPFGSGLFVLSPLAGLLWWFILTRHNGSGCDSWRAGVDSIWKQSWILITNLPSHCV